MLPAAIALYTWVAVAPREDHKLSVYSKNFDESVDLRLDEPAVPRKHWSDYVRGVALQLERTGHRFPGANLLIRSDLPMGAGLGSSAALEVAVGHALLGLCNHTLRGAELARLCQRAENEFVGARCGIMDQFVSCHGEAEHALLLDCRSLEYSLVPVPAGVNLVACNTMVKHALAGGEYNRRREECEEGVRQLSRVVPHVRTLRDVSLRELEQQSRSLSEVIYKRCSHVVQENDRVLQAAASLKAGDLAGFGRRMAESHRSLRDDFEVSCAELDLMVELAARTEGVCGARMTGGGFGGCTVNLVQSNRVDKFCRGVASAYEKETGLRPEIYVSCPAGGAGEVHA